MRTRRWGMAIAFTGCVITGGAGAGTALADAPPVGSPDLVLSATGSELRQECSQYAMNVGATAAAVRPLVPSLFVFSRDAAGKAVLGYRMFECRSLRIGDGPPRRVRWSELGVRVLPPEGLPEPHVDQHVDGHDYYMLAFRTDNPELAAELSALGLEPTGEPELLVQNLRYDLRRMPSPVDVLGDPSVSDAAQPVRLASRERVAGGAYRTRITSDAGLWFRKALSPYDVREWFLRDDCKVVSVFEHKERMTALLPSIRLTVDPQTLLGRLADTAPSADGRIRINSSTDVFVQFDEVMTWTVRDLPRALVHEAYDAVRGLSSAGGDSGCA